MESADIRRARKRLRELALFAEPAIDAAEITRLFGLTNSVFRVEIAGEPLCLRIPGDGTAALIDRAREAENARTAARYRVAPEVVHVSPDGVMLTRFIDGVPLSPQLFRDDPGVVARAAGSLRLLHDMPEDFVGLFDVFERMAFYRELLRERGATLAPGRIALLDGAEAIRTVLAAQPISLRPCHCDPTGRNLIDSGNRVWLIDWEYSGMNDPAWDLAYLSIEGSFDAAQEQALLAAYFGRAPRPAEAAQVAAFKALCQLLSALWAMVQDVGGNRAADFSAYADTTFAEAAELMRSPDFARFLSILRG